MWMEAKRTWMEAKRTWMEAKRTWMEAKRTWMDSKRTWIYLKWTSVDFKLLKLHSVSIKTSYRGKKLKKGNETYQKRFKMNKNDLKRNQDIPNCNIFKWGLKWSPSYYRLPKYSKKYTKILVSLPLLHSLRSLASHSRPAHLFSDHSHSASMLYAFPLFFFQSVLLTSRHSCPQPVLPLGHAHA